MSRVYYNNTNYFIEKAKLPKPDGKHCIICDKDLPKGRKKYCSDECFTNWYITIAKFDWNVLRNEVLRRDNFTCKICRKNQELYKEKYMIEDRIEVHHIKPIKNEGDEFDINNCITLCHQCHKEEHKRLNSLNKLKKYKPKELINIIKLDKFMM